MGGGGTVIPGGALTDAAMAAPVGNNFGSMTPSGLLGTMSNPTMMQSVAGGFPGLGRQIQGIGGPGMAQGGAGQGMRPQLPSNAVGAQQPLATLFGGGGQTNPLDHIWTQAFGPAGNPAQAAAASLGRGY